MIRRLFSPLSSSARVLHAGRWLRWVLPLAFLLAVALAGWNQRLEARLGSPLPLPPAAHYDPWLASRPAPGEAELDLDRVSVPQPFTIRSGQTLAALLQGLGLESSEAHAAIAELDDHVDPRRIRAGQLAVAYFDPAGELAALRLSLSGKGRADLERRGGGWRSTWTDFERETRLRATGGELKSSLEQAIVRAGGRAQLAYAMSEVLQWDLDFNRDLRIGDRFWVLYEEIDLEGDFYGLGKVLALVYENRDRRLEAYRYGDGYYDGNGRALRKMFLRSPMRFTRVTSRFSHRRFHPILKVHRPHYGVDYGAPKGTPVRATASGTVLFAGRSGGAGKMVKLRHPNGYVTAYLHLSGYAPGVRRGRRVSQGEVVGYVGSTGLSTAPHLDYRVQKDGRWIDPLKLKSEDSRPISPGEMVEFRAVRDQLRESLQAIGLESGPTLTAPETLQRVAGRPSAGRPSDAPHAGGGVSAGGVSSAGVG